MPLFILGAGGHAKVVAETATRLGTEIRAFVDPYSQHHAFCGKPVLDKPPQEKTSNTFLIAIGANDTRRRIFDEMVELGWQPHSLIDPTAVVSNTAKIGAGSLVCAGAIINAEAEIGPNTIINTAAVVEHDCIVGCHSHVAPRAVLGGCCVVGENSLIGIGAVVKPGTKIGMNTTIGGGSVVIQNVGDFLVAFGNPCRPVRDQD